MIFEISENNIEHIVSCPVCCNDDLFELTKLYLGNFEILSTDLCKTCGLNFRSKRPDLGWFESCWEQRNKLQKKQKINFTNTATEENRKQRYKRIVELIAKYISSGKLIDIGAGPGTGTKEFSNAGYDVIAVEPDSSRADIAEKKMGLKVLRSTVDTLEHDKNGYDVVTCIHSLEHFHNPVTAMEKVAELLRFGGFAYIEVPDYTSYVEDWNDALYLAHFTNFTQNSLALLGTKVGLKPVLRAYPQASLNGTKHLAIVFEKVQSVEEWKVEAADNLEEPSKRIYQTGVPQKNHIEFPIKFRIPELNDLSLAYKGTARVLASVELNYQTRALKFNSEECVFEIYPLDDQELAVLYDKELDDNEDANVVPEIEFFEL